MALTREQIIQKTKEAVEKGRQKIYIEDIREDEQTRSADGENVICLALLSNGQIAHYWASMVNSDKYELFGEDGSINATLSKSDKYDSDNIFALIPNTGPKEKLKSNPFQVSEAAQASA